MSDEKVIPIRRDKYEALMRDSEEFETYLLGAIHFGIQKEIPVVMMIGHLSRAIYMPEGAEVYIARCPAGRIIFSGVDAEKAKQACESHMAAQERAA